MENKQALEKLTTPSKSVLDNVHNRLVHSAFKCDSPFSFLPCTSTPPSRFAKIRNPFEPLLTERLHTHFLSPSMFANGQSPIKEGNFKWTIDEISIMKPADIDESSVDQFCSTDHDSALESFAQAKIERFFSMKEIVPSPCVQPVKMVKLISESPMCSKQILKKDGAAQTVLSLPPILPSAVEEALQPYFSYHKNQQEGDCSSTNTSMYRQLFDFDGQCPGSIHSSPARSNALSPVSFSPFATKINVCNRNSGSPHDTGLLKECILSPIDSNNYNTSRELKSAIRLDFSGHMSVDSSINAVPDTCNQMLDKSLNLDITPLPVEEDVLSNSLVNWDMEYQQVHLCSPGSKNSSTCSNEMDVSTSNTPRSKIFISQRKKLSDSFLNDDEKENFSEQYVTSKGANSRTFSLRSDVTDAGYQTGTSCHLEESTWSMSSLFASTPSKQKH